MHVPLLSVIAGKVLGRMRKEPENPQGAQLSSAQHSSGTATGTGVHVVSSPASSRRREGNSRSLDQLSNSIPSSYNGATSSASHISAPSPPPIQLLFPPLAPVSNPSLLHRYCTHCTSALDLDLREAPLQSHARSAYSREKTHIAQHNRVPEPKERTRSSAYLIPRLSEQQSPPDSAPSSLTSQTRSRSRTAVAAVAPASHQQTSSSCSPSSREEAPSSLGQGPSHRHHHQSHGRRRTRSRPRRGGEAGEEARQVLQPAPRRRPEPLRGHLARPAPRGRQDHHGRQPRRRLHHGPGPHLAARWCSGMYVLSPPPPILSIIPC